jgi:hypothetical protein
MTRALPRHDELQVQVPCGPAAGPVPGLAQRRRLLVGLGAVVAAPWSAVRAKVAAPAELEQLWPIARLQGQGRLRFLGLQVYEIRLWTPAPMLGIDNWAETPLALEIEYARSLDGRKIAQRSLEEMQRAGPIEPELARRWLDQMTALFPDVDAGDRITGVHLPGLSARFYLNGRMRGEVRHAQFARRFFGIWLGAATSEPALRDALMGRQ